MTVIHTTWASPSDPNYYDDNEYKRTLGDLMQRLRPVLVLDLHGSSPYRPYDVDIGTMNGDSLLGRERYQTDLVAALRQEGLTSLSGNYFSAARTETVTKFAASRGVPAIQLEINATYLLLDEGNTTGELLSAQRFARLAQALTRYLLRFQPSRTSETLASEPAASGD